MRPRRAKLPPFWKMLFQLTRNTNSVRARNWFFLFRSQRISGLEGSNLRGLSLFKNAAAFSMRFSPDHSGNSKQP